MDVLIVHQQVSGAAMAAPPDLDVLVQVAHVSKALHELGHTVTETSCSLDLALLEQVLSDHRPDVVFNLVESLAGRDQLAFLVPALLDVLRIPYTGTPTWGLYQLADKIRMKNTLVEHRLPTPAWWPDEGQPAGKRRPGTPQPGRYLVKTRSEHASFGIDDGNVVDVEDQRQLEETLQAFTRRLGRECFAEVFIDGRELNLSLLADYQGGVEVLPPAEIQFVGYPEDKPKIVGYRAKWDEQSREYHSTPRQFMFAQQDGPLLKRLQHLAQCCWDVFGLRGYGRVDFRVDSQGRPWILEVNANPCLSPEAGFAAALQQAGISFTEAIDRIVADARRTT